MSIIEAKKINYYYQDGDARRYILKDVSCKFEKGKLYTILRTIRFAERQHFYLLLVL